MPGHYHEEALWSLFTELEQQRMQMGLKRRLPAMGSATVTVGESQLEPDNSFYARGRDSDPTVVVEVGVSQSLGSLKIKAAVWCQLPGLKAVVLVDINTEKDTITVIKTVPVLLQDNGAGSGPSVYPQEAARIVVRSVEGTPRVYELDPGHDQAIALAYDAMTGEVAPAGGRRDFVLGSVFLRHWAAEVLA